MPRAASPILDTRDSHKNAAARKAVKAAGARIWFVSQYSPDLNPIEMIYAQRKDGLRHAAKRSVESIWRRISPLLDRFSREEGGASLTAGMRRSQFVTL